ncbi:hypothetical protein F5884DRAFT_836286 [Xylogone sp. PMI_703]|nr:hypothetical protein F5884DRAFT_836286 [Xylogone sp. PMI_703]
MARGPAGGHRSTPAKEAAKARDGYRCALSGYHGEFDVAHIFPFCLSKAKHRTRREHLFEMLGMFWPQDTVKSWKAEIFNEDGGPKGESSINLICLQPSLHRAWDNGRFALFPVSLSKDSKTLTLQFFWQPQHTGGEKVPPSTLPPETPDLIKDNEVAYSGGRGNIKSGDQILMTTDDPKERPLPSLKLLEMQWFLARIVGMAGAADVNQLDLDYDDDDDDGFGDQAQAYLDSSMETEAWGWEYSLEADTSMEAVDSVDSGLKKPSSETVGQGAITKDKEAADTETVNLTV